MKGIFKRNQVIITALAIMIAVAGYLNFAGDNVKDANTGIKNTTEQTTVEDDLLTSTDDIESLDTDLDSVDTVAEGETTQPGEAVLVNSSGNLTFVNEAKLNREQVRAKNKELLMEIINNANVSEAEKNTATANLVALTDISEKEAAAEMLLSAKGFEDSVVSITDGSVDVIINLSTITDVQRAQVEDVVKSKTGIAAKNITITPVTE
jgi:stage III sporulation protein AH